MKLLTLSDKGRQMLRGMRIYTLADAERVIWL
jgi:hypothetical protein